MTTHRRFLVLVCGACFGAVVMLPIRADEWPQYLGPTREGISTETEWNQDWDAKEPEILWQADIGQGCASFVVADGRAVSTGNADDTDTVYCFDARTGSRLWTHRYPQPLDPKYYKGGTSATPTVDGDRVYTVGKHGDLYCLNAATGAVNWHLNYQHDFGGRRQTWGWAASPLVDGDLLFVDPGGQGAAVVALDKHTGRKVWQSGNHQHGYAAPRRFRNAAGDGILIFGGTGLHAFAIEDGRELFSFPWATKYDVNASMPVAFGSNRIFISSGYGKGCAMIRVTDGKAEEVYRSDALSLQFQSGVRVGEHLFAVDGQTGRKAFLKCLHLPSGEVLWSEKLAGDLGTLIQVGGVFLIMKEIGELALANLSPAGYEELGTVQVVRKPVWAAPAFANGLLFCRNNDGRAVCVDLRR